MPVETLHTAAAAALDEWKTVRDCIAGARSIIAGKERYLPSLSKEPPEEYQKRQSRAVFFNATARTLEAMVGLLFRKPPEIELPDAFKAFLADCDLRGNPFVSYARDIANEVSSVGRAGTLVDWNEAEGRPYCAAYTAENIVNWQTARVAGRTVLTLVVLKESAVMPSDDPFAPKIVEQYRVLRLEHTEALITGCVSELWQKNAENKFAMIQTGELVRKGAPLLAIPFVFHNADKPGPDIGRVPLSDLAHVNVAHFRTSADLENGRHICGLPTPYAFGLDANTEEGSKPKELYLGSNYAWTSNNANAKAGFIEFTGQGLSALEKGLEEKEKQMAALGARLIEPPKKDAEAYETVQLRAGAEASTLARIGMLTTESLTWVLAWVQWWQGTQGNVQEAADGLVFTLNKDFVSTAITPEMLTAIVSARQANLISAETMFFNLQRGEFFPDGRTWEDEQGSIEENPPMPAPLPTPPIDPNKQPPPDA